MRFRGHHQTDYQYSAPVALRPHTVRLRPRADYSLLLHSFEVSVQPQPRGQAWGLDAAGSTILQLWWEQPVAHLHIETRFEVETHLENPFEFLLQGSTPQEEALIAPYRDGSPSPVIARYTQQALDASSGDAIAFLAHLARFIHAEFEQELRDEGMPHSAEETLIRRKGACRDLAVLYNAVARAAGFAARFVSGYDRESVLQDAGHMHAWSEVYLQGIGWRGFDPTRGLAVAGNHIPVAAARDPEGASPVTGSFAGSATARLTHNVELTEGSAT